MKLRTGFSHSSKPISITPVTAGMNVHTKRLPAQKHLFTGRKFGPELDE